MFFHVDPYLMMVEYISYNIGTRDLPDIYARGPRAWAYISGKYSCPCYNLYIRIFNV